MIRDLKEDDLEQYVLELLQSLGWSYLHGLAIAPEAEKSERSSFEQVLLLGRLRQAITRLNPDIPEEAQKQALQTVQRISSPQLITNNEQFHKYLIDGVPVQYRIGERERGDNVWLIDFFNPENNDYLVVNQYTVVEKNQNKRPDVVLFINGIPLVVIELKNPVDEHATIYSAFNQIQTYKATIPNLFTYNAFCVISDGHEARAGTISSEFGRFMAWKSIDGTKEASKFLPQLEVLIKGMLNKPTLLDLLRNFIVFEQTKKLDKNTGLMQVEVVKKLAAYHQYFAVNKAVESTKRAALEKDTHKGGVIWHTQGSGKSLTMVFYAAKIVASLDNPTIVVITDRNDLDDQLFDTFAASKQLLRQEPVQAQNREHLKELLKVASGGIVFTTIQKFFPDDGSEKFELLSERRNIVVIADEAHRTHYGFKAKLRNVKNDEDEVVGKQIGYGFAKYLRDALPNATYIGFTGTPIEKEDRNTPAVFGNYIDIYDIAQAVEDNATVKIFYESRLAKVALDEEGKKLIKELDNELEDDETITDRQLAKEKWARLETIVGNKQRLENLANDIVTHFEQRQSVNEGKGMIVAMSRRIAVDLYKEIVALRPEWHSDELTKGVIKVVMTASSSDGPEMRKHHTTKSDREVLAERFKDPNDSLKLVIVRDMWLTGFDVPPLHTMYIDKPMRGHTLMQAIARVNRVFKDKPGGLVVDYLGIASDLKNALSFYANAGGKGEPAETQEKAIEVMIEKLEVVRQMFCEKSKSEKVITISEPEAYYGHEPKFNYRRFFTASPQEKLSIILQAVEHILGLEEGKTRFLREVTLLNQAFALSIPHLKALEIKEEVAFFQAVRARLMKFDIGGRGVESSIEIDTAIKQIIDQAIISDKVIDIFDAAGIKKPDISILSDEFLEEVKGMKHKNIAFELLKKILNDEIKIRSKYSLVKSKALLEMLENAIKKYQNNLLTTAEIIQELIEIAKEIKSADLRGEQLNLTKEELAFYDALEVNDSAVQVLGDETLREIAREIANKVRSNTTIDWTIRESARAKLMVVVRRTLNKYGYPPDKQQKAIDTVLKQAELMAEYYVNVK
ncbi:MAG: type I restriction endonuclease subunit R [Ignavibacteria bacterium]|nr:type I restriction endonuclease subunit R [Ignavibacteria bacterium]